MIRIQVDDQWRVKASSETELPLAASTVWGQMRDLLGFICIDPLHRRAACTRDEPVRVGADLVIQHRMMGVGVDRVSRVLRWQEGRGYAVSDLSQRGVDVGFPHVCIYDVRSAGLGRSVLRVEARGVWTARMLPRWVVRGWLWWVLAATEACQTSALLQLKRRLDKEAGQEPDSSRTARGPGQGRGVT